MASHNDLGRQGEEIAAKYLKNKGYQLVERNWQYQQRELDLIAWEVPQELLVFVEVKTRSTFFFGYPEASIDEPKKRFLIDAANEYLQEHMLECELRFDVIAILVQNNKVEELNHIKDAVIP